MNPEIRIGIKLFMRLQCNIDGGIDLVLITL